jgi:hypothetical protein
MVLSQDEKNAKALREQIAKIPENKRCADCTAKGPVYANTTFNTFVCTACSGIHREFNHRVKSISMASFKPDEMKGLLDGGNAVAREKWLARWNPSEVPEPDPGDTEKLRQFIKMKYIDKRWVASSGASHTKQNTQTQGRPKVTDAHLPKPEPITNLLGSDLPPMHVRQQQQPQQNPFGSQPHQQNSDGGWASFDNVKWEGSAPSAPLQPANSFFGAAPTPSAQSTGLEGLLFPSQEETQRIEQEKIAKQQEEEKKKKNVDLVSQLGSLYQQQAIQQQQQQMMMMQQQMMKMAQGMQGLTPQQQQMYYQQMMMQMGAGGMMPGGMPGAMPGGMPGAMPGGAMPFGNPNPGFMAPPTGVQPGFGSTSPTGMSGFGGGGFGSPTTPSPFADALTPAEPLQPAQPAKPDPFAALSPFAAGGKPNANPPAKKPISPTSDPFGLGTTQTPSSNGNNVDPFNLGPTVQQRRPV